MTNLDGPPPAYEVNAPTVPRQSEATTESTANPVTTAVIDFEAPPPYCLVDPSKIPNRDHLIHYSQISPIEVIDLSSGGHHHSEQVYLRIFIKLDKILIVTIFPFD